MPTYVEQKPSAGMGNSALPCLCWLEVGVIELFLFGGLVTLAYLLHFTEIIPVVQQGFVCQDIALSKPFSGPSEAVPWPVLYAMAFGAPVVLIVVGELSPVLYQLGLGAMRDQAATAGQQGVPTFLRRLVKFTGLHLFGGCSALVLCGLGQVMTGSLAPYFLSVCSPNYTLLPVVSASPDGPSCVPATFISDDICAGKAEDIYSARRSFPSLHATLSWYAAVFMALYASSALCLRGTRLIQPLLVMGLLALAFLSAASRVTEYRSHAVDVLGGSVLGAAIAVYLSVAVLGCFRVKPVVPGDVAGQGGTPPEDRVAVITLPRLPNIPGGPGPSPRHYISMTENGAGIQLTPPNVPYASRMSAMPAEEGSGAAAAVAGGNLLQQIRQSRLQQL
ncbi:Phospholipid phosphatase- protein type 5 [Branchiostoma belcheri]|nr:Phospholipid phosphatase- protein type 5 [Branchiostoma belcheri]